MNLKETKKTDKETDNNYTFIFGKMNYILLLAGLVLLALGYILLCGGGSDDPTVFNPAMFDNRRLVAAPLCIVSGFIVEIFAIMIKPKQTPKE